MDDPSRANQEPLAEIVALKKRIQELETADAERKKAEDEAWVATQNLQSLLMNAKGFFIYQAVPDEASPYGARVVLVSPSITDVSGITDVYNFGAWFEEIHPDDMARVVAANKRSLETREPCDEVIRWYHRLRNEWIWVRTISTPVYDHLGRLLHFNGLCIDITERKRVEEALADRTAQLERANRKLAIINADIEEFINAASHDLQEPLRIIVAFSGLLRKDLGDSLPERAGKDFAFLTDAANRMQKLIQDLLALSRAGRVAKKREKISLGECADRALEALAIGVKQRGAQITRDKLPEVWGDSTLLTQLYQNLIGNALKFSGDPCPIIHLTFEEKDGEQIFGVKDNGIGIEPKYAQEIFQPFRRLHGRAEYEGSGLGLTICRRIVERHRGKIWVDSELGKGAHFRFTISHKKRGGESH
jgi:PAS domain S-box-containing protein